MSKKNIEAIYPLSAVQQGILFHSLYAPGSGAYLTQIGFILESDLNVQALERAWQRELDRHSVLRTLFAWEGRDEPLQIVRKSVSLPMERQDWRGLSASEQEERMARWLEEDRARGFDFSQAPIMRLTLIQTGDCAYQLIWTHHHLLIDGWSASLILNEVFTLYDELYEGRDLPLPNYRPFRDYISWLRQQDLKAAEAYWRKRLRGISAPTPLTVTASVKDSGRKEEAARHEIKLSQEATNALQSMARQHRLTMSTIVQGAWGLLLSRYSRERDVVFGTIVSGRPAEMPGVESMVGMFINSLPIRLHVDYEQRLVPWLTELQEQSVELRQYEYSPLIDVQGWSDVPRGLPLFETLLAYQNYPVDDSLLSLSTRMGIQEAWGSERTTYAITVEAGLCPELLLRINYDSSRFDDSAMLRMAGHLRTLLEGFAANPEERILNLPMLTQGEREQAIVDWNNTSVCLSPHGLTQEIIEAQAARTPEKTAIICNDQSASYGEINRRANSMARALIAEGVGPEVVVALLCERGINFLISMLAIFKAGGAYVPLDPKHPARRTCQVITQSEAAMVIAEEGLLSTLSQAVTEMASPVRPHTLILEELLGRQERQDDLPPRCAPDNLAYVIYTSGSTGLPKGAMIDHKGMLNHLLAKVVTLQLTQDDTVAQNASQSFDISVWQYLSPLLVGGTVSVFDDEAALDPSLLLKRIDRDQVTIMETVPSMMRVMLEEIDNTGVENYGLPTLRWLMPNGEALTSELCRRWLGHYPGTPIINAYGATECSDDVSQYPIYDSSAAEGLHVMPLGFPLPNMSMYVLDSQLEPVPVGVAGEAHFGGIGVGRGYLNRPDLTAERFVPDSLGSEPGARLYKSGDLTRYMEDGNVEFLGRLDHQVKIRGFRIEIGEIESVIASHPAVKEVVVMAREDARGEHRLAAYVVPNNETDLAASSLKGYVKEKLPEYMTPSVFVLLDQFPLNSNGKVDRKALPAPDHSREEGEDFVPARNPVEEMLSGIWAEVLKLDRVGVRDNFFELGGHSLLAIQVISRARAAFGIEIALQALFESPTVEALSLTIIEGLAERLESEGNAEFLGLLEQLPSADAGISIEAEGI